MQNYPITYRAVRVSQWVRPVFNKFISHSIVSTLHAPHSQHRSDPLRNLLKVNEINNYCEFWTMRTEQMHTRTNESNYFAEHPSLGNFLGDNTLDAKLMHRFTLTVQNRMASVFNIPAIRSVKLHAGFKWKTKEWRWWRSSRVNDKRLENKML